MNENRLNIAKNNSTDAFWDVLNIVLPEVNIDIISKETKKEFERAVDKVFQEIRKKY